MRVVKANAKLVKHNMPAYKFIERVGRTCYKSEGSITPESAVKFVQALTKNGHFAMLEHEYLYLEAHEFWIMDVFVENTKKSFLKYLNIRDKYASGSFRAWIEFFENTKRYRINRKSYKAVDDSANADDLYKTIYQIFAKKYPEVFCDEYWILKSVSKKEFKNLIKMISRDDLLKAEILFHRDAIISALLPHTILFTCDRGVSHELVRHRPAAFAQESTRYCNYSKDKFDNQVVFIEPCFWPDHDSVKYRLWKDLCDQAETAYFELLNEGATPQEARGVLPNSTKTEIFVTATEDEWKHILNLRYIGTTGAPHPQMLEVMNIAYPQLVVASDNRLKIKKKKNK